MFKTVFIAISLMFIIIGCETMPVKDDKDKDVVTKKEENITREKNPKMEVTIYGADKEIQAVDINDKTYYIIGGKNIENMSEDEIKSSSIVSPLKITEETIKGVRGIVVMYYDVKVFLGKKGATGTTVGIFEPQKNDWTIGDDMDRSQSIQIKLSRGVAGPIAIKRGSISLNYR